MTHGQYLESEFLCLNIRILLFVKSLKSSSFWTWEMAKAAYIETITKNIMEKTNIFHAEKLHH